MLVILLQAYLGIRHGGDIHSGQAHAVAHVHTLAAVAPDYHLLRLEPAGRLISCQSDHTLGCITYDDPHYRTA